MVFANDSEQDVIFASQTLTDALDRDVLATLPAPLTYFDREANGEIDFRYDGYFILNNDDEIYNYTDFDNALRFAPDPVGDAQQGTLGWYYSDNNTLEPYTPTTDYPYTRKEYYDDGTGEPKRVAGPGDYHHLGTGHETLAGTFPVTGELIEYNTMRQLALNTTSVDLKHQALLSIAIDANGQSVVSVLDKEQKTLMIAEGIDPLDETDNSKEFVCSESTDFANGKTVLYFYLLKDQAVTWFGTGTYNLTEIIKDIPVDPAPTTLPRGFYKVSLTGNRDQDVTVSYKNKFATISYSFYDDAGRLVSSVSPNGVLKWRDGENYDNIDKTTYVYNHQGWLLSMTEPDAGTTKFMYRKDGNIRFSQNEEQGIHGKFSYTHYDKTGRPVESGEYFSGPRSFDDSQLNLWLEDTYGDFTDRGWDKGVNVQDWVFTGYDLPDDDELQSKTGLNDLTQTFLMGAVSYAENANMKTWYSYDRRGRVTWMVQLPKAIDESDIKRAFKIAYSYDFLGNVTDVAFAAYDPDDGVMTPIEQFHHHYEYDNNQRLTAVYASEDGAVVDENMQAKYYYYLHGPLKRVELGQNKQGIDYVYTIQGWLKSINHPEESKDPGRDGNSGDHADFEKDLFAMTLEYFNGDYTRSGTNINSVDAGREYFNGNIRNITWRTGAEQYGAEPVMYTYAYDDKYQLKGADFGTPDYNNNALLASLGDQYKVSKLSYDANGNIQGLHRFEGLDFSGIAKPLHDFTNAYKYDIANTNKLTSITGHSVYEYNAIGQLIMEDPNEVEGGADIRRMNYDVTGKVTSVTDNDQNAKVTFTYDDRGFRLMKRNLETGLETWYIRDASGNVLTTYEKRGEETELKETMIYGSGRIGMYRHDYLKTKADVVYITGHEVRNAYEDKNYELLPGGTLVLTDGFTFDAAGVNTFTVSSVTGDEIMGAHQYELTDHLGNVRIGVADESTAITFGATMELEKSDLEDDYFMNLDTRFNDPLFNHTAAGTYSSKLHPTISQDGSVLDAIGPAINLAVSPGDTVCIKVFSHYINAISDPGNVVPALLSALAGSFGHASPAGEAVQLVDAFGAAFTAGAAIPNADRQGAPKAYLQYIVFNKNMTMAQHGHIMVDPTQKGSWQKMEMEVPIEGNGYIYIYVANESMDNVNVYFDDMEVQLIDAPTTSASDYYPFGLAMAGRSYSSEKYRFGYQGQFAELDEETGWNSFELRMYEPVIGRWMAVDPKRQHYSPYLSMGNNAIRKVDPDGGGDGFRQVDGSWQNDGSGIGGNDIDYFFFDDGRIFMNDYNDPGRSGFFTTWDQVQPWEPFDLWNNDIFRQYVVPDKINISLNLSSTFVIGTGMEYTLNLLTRGPDAGFHLTRTESIQWGGEIDWGLNFGTGNYLGEVKDIYASSLKDKSIFVGFNALFGYKDSFGLDSFGDRIWQNQEVGVIGLSGGFSTGTGKTFLVE
ncbi:MAG: hypothetical protein HC819_04135 [Cyclobacteriaceae bacterium]|nr:hypothetical protein [Cyclobacteriaceae bacterium]